MEEASSSVSDAANAESRNEKDKKSVVEFSAVAKDSESNQDSRISDHDGGPSSGQSSTQSTDAKDDGTKTIGALRSSSKSNEGESVTSVNSGKMIYAYVTPRCLATPR